MVALALTIEQSSALARFLGRVIDALDARNPRVGVDNLLMVFGDSSGAAG